MQNFGEQTRCIMGDVQMETAQFGNVFFHGSNFGNEFWSSGVKKKREKKKKKRRGDKANNNNNNEIENRARNIHSEYISCKAIKLTREFSSF